ENHVQGLLVSRRFAEDTATAKVQHDRLFVFLMRFLSQPKPDGARRLTCVELSSCLESFRIQPEEQRVLDEIQRTRRLIIDGFADMQREFDTVKRGIGDIKGFLGSESPHSSRSSLQAVIDETSVKTSFEVASVSLLSWPKETRGKWFDRPELDNLYKTMHHKERSCTVLLGAPGCGKSALLAQLGKTLQNEGCTLL